MALRSHLSESIVTLITLCHISCHIIRNADITFAKMSAVEKHDHIVKLVVNKDV